MRCLLIPPWPFASLLVEQVLSMGSGLVEDAQPASEGVPGLASFPSVPCPQKEAAHARLCTPAPLCSRERAWLQEGSAQEERKHLSCPQPCR